MPSWPALLLAPLVALSQLSIAYSLVAPECGRQDRSGLHAVSVVSLLIVLVLTAMAWLAWRQRARGSESDGAAAHGERRRAVSAASGDEATQRPSFIALIAVLIGALSALVSVALWVPIWFLSPCS